MRTTLLDVAYRALVRLDARRGTHVAGVVSALPALLRHARDPRSRLSILRAAFRLGGRRPGVARVRLPGPSGPRWFELPDWAALLVLVEVLVDAEYAVEDEASPPRVVLDLGANIGASAAFFRGRYPDARIVAVEASPAIAAVLERNVASLDVEVVHAAVAAEPGTITFHAGDSWAGTTGAPGDGGVEVPAVTLDELLERYEPDLVKIDVEGAELDVLPAAGDGLDRVRTILGELHGTPGSPAHERVLERLAGWRVATRQAEEFVVFTARS